jgi:crotonobetainyl-CoA:carnitine CoA-transferase CaiB-like acyl-CoA transferase
MDYAINARVRRSTGNQHPQLAPCGVYPCAGEDRWIALGVWSDAQWQALRAALGDPSWARGPRFESAAGRRRHRREIDQELARFTRTRGHLELMRELQARGVPAAAVQDAAEHAADPHWQARGFYQPIQLGQYGVFPLPTSPWIVDGRRLGVRLPPPAFGQHNRAVLGGLLGLGEAELAQLAAERIIGDEPLPHEI